MQYALQTSDFVSRDRFVLSHVHTCLSQYVFLHLSGFKSMSMKRLRSYHATNYDSLCPGHPEIEHQGIEVITDPLGEGNKFSQSENQAQTCSKNIDVAWRVLITNAVGLAVVEKKLGCNV